ncbi:hypothetical protein [Arthrobacter oryzae]|uniref:hypothetical protein n=1 Tax=Arthrobacter oryzae TaxID=409290 RepID=UPI0028579DB8|nr:hypothetical protein [Arthrobacter oryzae]MDR6506052.1 hypothetical protein [Arthrobacter oryzae]
MSVIIDLAPIPHRADALVRMSQSFTSAAVRSRALEMSVMASGVEHRVGAPDIVVAEFPPVLVASYMVLTPEKVQRGRLEGNRLRDLREASAFNRQAVGLLFNETLEKGVYKSLIVLHNYERVNLMDFPESVQGRISQEAKLDAQI